MEDLVERNHNGYIIISQLDVYHSIFLSLHEDNCPADILIPAVVEYLRSVCRHYLRPERVLNELLVNLLVSDKRYYELHQYLQYHILTDSLPIAEKLIDLADIYPAAYQLGLDMLYRLNAFSRLLQLLLKDHQVVAALTLVSHRSSFLNEPGLQSKDFLRIAAENDDVNIFYSTYKFFQSRNTLLRGNPAFIPEDQCTEYVAIFDKIFPTERRQIMRGRYSSVGAFEDIESESEESDDEDGLISSIAWATNDTNE